MTRVRSRGVELSVELRMYLMLGPAPIWEDDFTDEDLEIGWRLHGQRIMEEWKPYRGSRPWGWWRFETETGEEPELAPGASEIMLAQLGELTDDEFAAIARRAAEAQAQLDSGIVPYIATGGGRRINFEEEAIDLFKRIQEARR
jgi:hypothetical protein